MDRLLTMQGQKIVETNIDFPFQIRIETTDRLPAIEGKKLLKTALRFSS